MSATENTAVPVIDVPPKDETPVETPSQNAPVNATTAATATGVNATGPKVNPVQRLSSVYKKAKQTVTDVVTEAHKALNEKKTSQAPANPTTNDTPAREADTTTETVTPTEKKASGPNTTFKDLLNRVKGLNKHTSNHAVAVTPTAVDQPTTSAASTDESTAPVPPPKDNAKPSTTNANPILDQLKRNSTLLSNYILQKKQEFTEKKSTETSANNNEHSRSTPEAHANIDQPATGEKTPASPLVRRIAQLVHTATTTINKKKDQLMKQNHAAGETTADTTATESPTTVGGTA